jgi:adenosine deaminase
MKLSKEFIQTIPKVLLHDHLDGGVRPQTVIDLAKEQGYNKLPTSDAAELDLWFQRGAQRGSLPLFLEGFEHTCGVMVTEEALERVAYETVEDMKNDGVVYFETRFAPVFHTGKGLSVSRIVKSVLKGLERGKKEFGVHYGVIICAMRHMEPSVSLKWQNSLLNSVIRVLSDSISQAKKEDILRRSMWMHSTTFRERISISPSTPAKRSARNPSGRRSNGAVRTVSVTAHD